MSAAVTGEFHFSPLVHETIRYDAKSNFFVENLQEYLAALLRASTDKYVVQRLLIEICSTRAFDRMLRDNSMDAIYDLFRMHRDCLFYMNAFYYALQHTSQRNYFKILIINTLNEGAAAGNCWNGSGTENRLLQQGWKHIRCNGCSCIGTGCKHCEIAYDVAFRDLLAALRCAQANQ